MHHYGTGYKYEVIINYKSNISMNVIELFSRYQLQISL